MLALLAAGCAGLDALLHVLKYQPTTPWLTSEVLLPLAVCLLALHLRGGINTRK